MFQASFWFGDTRIIQHEIESGYGGIRFKIPYKAGLPNPSSSEIDRLRSVQLDIAVGVNLECFAKRSRLDSTLDIFSGVAWNIYQHDRIPA